MLDVGVDGFLSRGNKDSGVTTDWERARFLCDQKTRNNSQEKKISQVSQDSVP